MYLGRDTDSAADLFLLDNGSVRGFRHARSVSRSSLGGEVHGVTWTRMSAWSAWRRLTAAWTLVAQEWLLVATEAQVWVAQVGLPGTPVRSPTGPVVWAGDLEASGRRSCGGQSGIGCQVPVPRPVYKHTGRGNMQEDVHVEAHDAAAGEAGSGLQVGADHHAECSWQY